MSGKPRVNEIEEAQRNKRIWELRLAHKSQLAIAEEVGLSQQQVSRILNEMAKNYVAEEISTYLAIQLTRLDELSAHLLEIATREHLAHNNGKLVRNPDTNELIRESAPEIAAYGKYLDVMKEKAKLLGLYAPEKKEVSTKVEVNPSILSLIQQTQEEDNG